MAGGIVTRLSPRGRLKPRGRATAMGSGWVAAGGIGVAAIVGLLVGIGQWQIGLVAVAAPAFVIFAIAAPERTTLGLIVALPFMVVPFTFGGFSLFLGVPLFGFTSVVLLMRQRGAPHGLHRDLPAIAFGVLVGVALLTAVASTDPVRGFSRIIYLVLFGLFAWSLAATISSGRLSREAVVKAIVISGAVAAVAVSIQFVLQFVIGKDPVFDWLRDVESLFAAQRAGVGVDTRNWITGQLDLLRGIFPFMTPPSAGQYLMLSLIAAVWLLRERKGRLMSGLSVELVLVVIIAAGLLFTFSRQSWVGAAIGLVALGMSRRPGRLLWAPVALAVAAIIPIPGSDRSFGDYLLGASGTSSADERIEFWGQAVEAIPDHALLGLGPGLIGTLDPTAARVGFYAHNVFLDMAVELGIAGVLALIAVLVLGLAAALRQRAALPFAMITAFIVASIFDDVFYFPRNGLLLAVAFALIVEQSVRGEGSDRSRRGRPSVHAETPSTPGQEAIATEVMRR